MGVGIYGMMGLALYGFPAMFADDQDTVYPRVYEDSLRHEL